MAIVHQPRQPERGGVGGEGVRSGAGEKTIEESSIVKYLASNVMFDVADDVVQVHGANGLAEDNPFMHELETARILRVVEGTDEIQLNTIAKELGVS